MTDHQPPPERSLEQRMAALATANRVRTVRRKLKEALRAREVSLEAVVALDLEGIRQAVDIAELEDGDLDTMRVYDAILAAPKFGRVKANRALNSVPVSPSKTLAGLTYRQRVELLVALGFADREEYAAPPDVHDHPPTNGHGGTA